jgi:chondroitin 4-sulfotransferase 11
MIIDHDKKYVFIAVPKTGSISIQCSLGYGNDIPEPDLYHQSINQALAECQLCLGYFKFAFVRNPWARLLSLYNDFTIKRIYQYSGLIKHDKPLFSEFENFNDFCIKLHNSPWLQNVFLKTQTELLSINGELKMDFVGRFERLQEDFDIICKTIKIETKLLKLNVGEYDNTNYRVHYTDEAKNAIEKLYKSDIEMFNYEF